MIILLADVNNLTYLCKFVNKPRRDFLYSAAEFRVFCCHLYVLHSFAILNCRRLLRRLYDDFSQKKSTKPGFYAENRFFWNLYTFTMPLVYLSDVYYTSPAPTSHIVYIFRVILPNFLLKNRFFLPQYQWNISQRRNLLIFSGKICWNLTIFPVFSEEASSFCPKLSFSFWTSTKKIHKSHCSSISSDILWHRIVLFVPRSRINAHTFHFFRRTPAGYCPAPANAATFPCHTPPRSPL